MWAAAAPYIYDAELVEIEQAGQTSPELSAQLLLPSRLKPTFDRAKLFELFRILEELRDERASMAKALPGPAQGDVIAHRSTLATLDEQIAAYEQIFEQ